MVLPPKLVVLEPFLANLRETPARELRLGEIVRRIYQRGVKIALATDPFSWLRVARQGPWCTVEKPVGARFGPRPATRHTALGAFQARFLLATSNADDFDRLVVSPKWELVFVIEPSAIAVG